VCDREKAFAVHAIAVQSTGMGNEVRADQYVHCPFGVLCGVSGQRGGRGQGHVGSGGKPEQTEHPLGFGRQGVVVGDGQRRPEIGVRVVPVVADVEQPALILQVVGELGEGGLAAYLDMVRDQLQEERQPAAERGEPGDGRIHRDPLSRLGEQDGQYFARHSDQG
jgi:hypothetical protein